LFLLALNASAQSRDPNIGYLYPAGAQQGTVVHVIAGGQFLNAPSNVYVTGEGVEVSVVKRGNARRNINRDERWLLLSNLVAICESRLGEAGLDNAAIEKERQKLLKSSPWSMLKRTDIEVEGEKVPFHPMLMNPDDVSLREAMHVKEYYFFPRYKLQENRQLNEMVLLEVRVAPDAPPGERELRLKTSRGLTNPMLFHVGVLPETNELEPNDTQVRRVPDIMKAADGLAHTGPLDLPVLLNGQIMPGDVDRFRLRAKKGRLVIEANARRLIPYLADAVPGWFQATLALYDADGREVAYADDHMFNPDPILTYDVPSDGEYELEIRDAIYRGRDDFVYRVSVSDRTYTHEPYPVKNVPPDLFHAGMDAMPECGDKEPNNSARRAQRIELPQVVSGRIGKAGDVDVFEIRGRAGDKVVAEVYARRIGSPLDSLVRLVDRSGKIVAWNDDHFLKEGHLHLDRVGLVTHHADSYLLAELPADGVYTVQVSDTRRHGGEEYGYRLRVSEPIPDFALRITPSSLFLRPGEMKPVRVYALRRDGFDGAIEVSADGDSGFGIAGGTIAAGRNSARLMLVAPPKAPEAPAEPRFVGTAAVDGESFSRAVMPAENVMQAFLWRHLVPARSLVCDVMQQKWRMPAMKYGGEGPVRLEAGGTAQVTVTVPKRRDLAQFRLVLDNPPEGVSVGETVTEVENGIAFELKASENIKKDFKGNLVVQVFKENTIPAKDGKKARKNRWPFVFLPAIPVEIVPSS